MNGLNQRLMQYLIATQMEMKKLKFFASYCMNGREKMIRIFDASIWCLISFIVGTFFGVMMLAVLSAGRRE